MPRSSTDVDSFSAPLQRAQRPCPWHSLQGVSPISCSVIVVATNSYDHSDHFNLFGPEGWLEGKECLSLGRTRPHGLQQLIPSTSRRAIQVPGQLGAVPATRNGDVSDINSTSACVFRPRFFKRVLGKSQRTHWQHASSGCLVRPPRQSASAIPSAYACKVHMDPFTSKHLPRSTALIRSQEVLQTSLCIQERT